METVTELIGDGKELSSLQMCIRALIVFLLAYILIRISGRRSFALRSPLDNIIVILLGAILSRGIVGASPFLPIIASCLLIVILHRLFAWLTSAYPVFGHLISGRKILLYSDGKFVNAALNRGLIGREEIMEQVRNTLHTNELNKIDRIYMERDGRISILIGSNKKVLSAEAYS